MNSDFENRLSRQPLKQVPRDWRRNILQNAKASTSAPSPAATPSWWRELLWPCPQAWAALAAVWIALAVFHFSASTETVTIARNKTSSPNWVASLREQERAIAEVLNSTAPHEADRPKRFAPSPSSQYRREELVVV